MNSTIQCTRTLPFVQIFNKAIPGAINTSFKHHYRRSLHEYTCAKTQVTKMCTQVYITVYMYMVSHYIHVRIHGRVQFIHVHVTQVHSTLECILLQ